MLRASRKAHDTGAPGYVNSGTKARERQKTKTDGFKERRNTSGAKKAEDVLQHIGPIGQTNVLTRNQGLWEHIRIHKRSKGAGMMRCRVECAG
ncbi:uncharacterized [Tachysurus ichikawai]